MQVTTKDVKKEDRFCMKSKLPEGIVCKGCFSNSTPTSVVQFSNISIP